jgi:hypothetical protein
MISATRMSKTVADNLKKIEIWWLKKYGYLEGWRTGGIEWKNRWSGSSSSIGFEVKTAGKDQYIRFRYSQTESGGIPKEFDYKVALTATTCYFGGFRFWFRCPLSINGRYCGRRVGVLYKLGDYFGCRHCNNLTYDSRKLSGWEKAGGRIISIPELERTEAEVKRQYYRGKMTKKYKRYLLKKQKSSFKLWAAFGAIEKRRGAEKYNDDVN